MGKVRVAFRGFADALDRLLADPEPSGEVARKVATLLAVLAAAVAAFWWIVPVTLEGLGKEGM